MKKIYITFFLLLASLTNYGQNEKNIVVDGNAEVRQVASFSGIEVSGAIDLYLSQGNEEAVAISASSDEIKQRIRTEVRNGSLLIYFDGKGLNWKIWGNHKMKAYVTFKTLKRLEASGACNVRATEPIRQDELKMELSGASDFSGEVNVKQLRIDASGASNARIAGSAEETNIIASGACTIKAYDLKTSKCKTDANGASHIRITVEKELDAQASGGSSIYFKGNGLIRNISSSGGATVKRADN